jgi:(p)ppGpp synthase/HD superfamily hydrolase
MKKHEIIQWCLDQHRNTNHFYDTYLPYEHHQRMVKNVFDDFKHLLPKNLFVEKDEVVSGVVDIKDITLWVIELSCWGHDVIEDTRTSYNDVKEVLGRQAADIIFAVSNEKGKTRSERANDKYYEGIRETEGAVFVKLCDRIANVQYSKMMKSRMFEMYKKENENFINKIGYKDERFSIYIPMFEYLIDLFK